MINTGCTQRSDIPIPSYLEHFETEFKKIKLIYSKRPSVTSQNDPVQVEILNDNSLNECDLTGDPLKVDLGGSEDSIIIKVEEVANNWSNNEAKHFPLSIRDARRELNQILKRSDEETEQDLPVYVICDGKNSQNTVVLGGHKKSLTSYCFDILDLILKGDAAIELDNMVKYHSKLCNNNTKKINYVTKMKYNIYGRSLKNLSCQNTSMRNFDYPTSVSVSVACNECVFNAYDGRNVNLLMNLELVAGHRLLSLNLLWQEMIYLQNYLDILLDNDLPLNNETILCKDPLESDEILRNIGKLVDTRFLRSSTESQTVDLAHVREGDLDFLDELWNILKYCENATILQNSFHFLFEDITASNNKSMMIRDKTSNVARLIDGILNGKLILSAVTLQQAVELLFELGAYKLKYDFQAILKQFSSTMKTNIDTVWKGFLQKPPLSQSKTRTTRVTQSLQHSQLDMKTKQLAYLSQLYVGAEFMYLIKEQVALQENTFYYLCECVEKEFVSNSKKFIDFLEVFQTPLCEMSFQLDSKNINIIQSLLPSNWSLQMSSKVHGTTVTTIYNLSESSIYPPCIYDYDIPLTDKPIYFVSRMTKTKGLF